MIIDTCDWNNPGQDAYSGPASVAIMAFAEIPPPVRRALVAKADRHEFDDAVLIDNDSIRGRREYRDLRSMHFGSKGKVCRNVTWHWPADRVEGGWVYCDSGYCVLAPAICRNWSIVTLVTDGGALLEPAPAAGPVGAQDVVEAFATPAAGTAPPEAEPDLGQARALSFDGGALTGFYAAAPILVFAAPVAEPQIGALMLLGLATLMAWQRINPKKDRHDR